MSENMRTIIWTLVKAVVCISIFALFIKAMRDYKSPEVSSTTGIIFRTLGIIAASIAFLFSFSLLYVIFKDEPSLGAFLFDLFQSILYGMVGAGILIGVLLGWARIAGRK